MLYACRVTHSRGLGINAPRDPLFNSFDSPAVVCISLFELLLVFAYVRCITLSFWFVLFCSVRRSSLMPASLPRISEASSEGRSEGSEQM